jgi:hypothetical protein
MWSTYLGASFFAPLPFINRHTGFYPLLAESGKLQNEVTKRQTRVDDIIGSGMNSAFRQSGFVKSCLTTKQTTGLNFGLKLTLNSRTCQLN